MRTSRKGIDLWQIQYPMMNDAAFLSRELRSGKTQKELAKEIGCSEKTLRKALRFHNLAAPLYLILCRKTAIASS